MSAGLSASERRRSGELRRPRGGLREREVLEVEPLDRLLPLVPLEELEVPLEELKPLERLGELELGERERAGMAAGCYGPATGAASIDRQPERTMERGMGKCGAQWPPWGT